jgi:hypothetical protein
MGTSPVMVDIMPKISGVEFEEAWRRRVDVRIDDDLSVPFISREDLLVAKHGAVSQWREVARNVAVGMTIQELEAFGAAFEHEEEQSAKQWLA